MDINTSRILLGAAGAGGKEGYITTFSTYGNLSFSAIATSNGQVFVGGRGVFGPNTSINHDSFIASINSDGTVSWQKTFTSANTTTVGYGQDGDSLTSITISPTDNNLYIGHKVFGGGGGYPYGAPGVVKMQQDGTSVWSRLLTPNVDYNGDVRSVAIDGTGNIYAGGNIDYGYNEEIIAKFNSTLTTKTWAYCAYRSGWKWIENVRINGANVHFAGASGVSSNIAGFYVKVGTDGSLQYVVNHGTGFNPPAPNYGCAFDSNLNYFFISTDAFGCPIIAKYSVEPTMSNISKVGGSANGQTINSVSINNLNKMYITGSQAIGSNGAVTLYEFSTANSLNKIWESSFKYTVGSLTASKSASDDDYIYVCGTLTNSSSNTFGFVLKVPNDGQTGFGTYGNFVYGQETNTVFSNTTFGYGGSSSVGTVSGVSYDGWYDITYIEPSVYSNTYTTSTANTSTTKVG